MQVDELKGQLAARDTALRQASEVASSAGRGSKATESELAARSARLNRALEEVQRYRKLLEDAKVRLSLACSGLCVLELLVEPATLTGRVCPRMSLALHCGRR